jgi:hypothetical protein
MKCFRSSTYAVGAILGITVCPVAGASGYLVRSQGIAVQLSRVREGESLIASVFLRRSCAMVRLRVH